MKLSCALFGAAILCLSQAPATQAQPPAKDAHVVAASIEVLDGLAGMPEKGIPPAMLCDAYAVAIVPDIFKAGFIIGGRHGRGVVLVREPGGGWSNPVFLTVTGGSVGWQIGAQRTDLVLIFRTPKSVDRLLQGKGKFTLGADASIAAGPVGREAAAATDLQLKAEIYSYSRSRGLFAGVSLAGDAVLIDCAANERFYQIPGLATPDLVAGRIPMIPEVAFRLRMTLAKYASPR
jgi:lipid-binding SYLF domain-containing protein